MNVRCSICKTMIILHKPIPIPNHRGHYICDLCNTVRSLAEGIKIDCSIDEIDNVLSNASGSHVNFNRSHESIN